MKNSILDILKKKDNGFKVPNGYFDSIEDNLITKMKSENFPVKEGFTIPKDYFESVEDEIFTKLGKDTLVKENSSVPNGYFETFEDRVFDRLKEEESKEPKVINLASRFKKALIPLTIAASFLLIFALQYSNSTGKTIEDVAESDVENWINDNHVNLNSYEIAEVFHDIEIDNEEANEDLELIEYLNGTDIENMMLDN